MPMHRQERRAAAAQVGHGASDGLGNVVELEVREHLVAPVHEPVEQLEIAARGEEFQPDLVEAGGVAEAVDLLEAPRKAPVVPILLGAVAVASAVFGAVSLWQLEENKNRANPTLRDTLNVTYFNQANTWGQVAIATFAVAGAALLTSIVTWLVL